MKELKRSANKRFIMGVCGGIGEYFGVDPTIIRLLFIILAFITKGIFVLFYIIAFVLMPAGEADSENLQETHEETDEPKKIENSSSDEGHTSEEFDSYFKK